jgi:hypothetical protein
MVRPQKRLIVALGRWNPVALLIAAAVVGGSLLAAWSVSQSIIRAVSPILAFSTATLTDARTATAGVTTTFDVNAALQAAPANAPVQSARVIACTYILTDGHRCD